MIERGEDLAQTTAAGRDFERLLLLFLALGVAVPAIVVFLAVRRITGPSGHLVSAAGTRELAALNAIAATVSQSLDLNEVLNSALDKVLQVMDIEAGGIYLLDEEAGILNVVAQRGFSRQFVAEIDRLKVGEGFSGQVSESGKPLVVANVSDDPRLTRLIVREEGLRSLAIAPLSHKSKVLGTLFVSTHGTREFTDQDVQLLTSIGHQVGVAVENARLFEDEQRRAEQFRVISEVGRRITSILDINELLKQIAKLVKETFDYYAVGLGLIEGDEVVFRAGAGSFWDDREFQILSLKVGEVGITGWVAETGEPLLIPDVSNEPRYFLPRLAQAHRTRSELAVPMTSKKTVIGVLDVESDRENAFGESDLQLLQSIANQAAIAIENARLFDAEQRRAEQFRVISEVGRGITSILSVDELLGQIAGLIQEAFDYYLVEIGLLEGNELVFKTRAGRGWDSPFQSFSLGVGQQSVTGWVAAAGEPLMVPDVSQEPRYVKITATETRSELAVPIKVKENTIGVLNLESERLDAFDESDLVVIQSLADQAAVAIENARLFEAEQRRAEQFRVITEVGRRITSILDIDEVLVQVVRLIKQSFNYDHVSIALIEGGHAVYQHGAGDLWDDPDFEFRPARLKVGGEGVTGWVAATGAPLLVPDVSQEPHYVWMEGSHTRSELAVPIKAKGEVIGVLDAQSDRLRAFDDSDLAVLQSLANQAAIAIENARLYEGAQQLAVLQERNRLARDLHDAVTQTLFSASLIAEALPVVWSADLEQGTDLLNELRQLNRGALAEMRTLLLELRPAALVETSLDDLLRQLGTVATGRIGLPVQVEVEGRCIPPADVHVALYRIAQEALNNVIIHAQASHVELSLHCASSDPDDTMQWERMELQVNDDGVGFDPNRVQQDRLGLGILRERARAIGANLTIRSRPGQGTRIVAIWERKDGGIASTDVG